MQPEFFPKYFLYPYHNNCTFKFRRKQEVVASSRGGEKTNAASKKGPAASQPNRLRLLYLQQTVQGSFWPCGSCATQAPSMINTTGDMLEMPTYSTTTLLRTITCSYTTHSCHELCNGATRSMKYNNAVAN